MHAIRECRFESKLRCISADGRVFTIDEGADAAEGKDGSPQASLQTDGVITAANSSQVSDGAAALVLASAKAVEQYKLVPMGASWPCRGWFRPGSDVRWTDPGLRQVLRRRVGSG
jgi:hypothetical protein